ncbi:MAG: GH3 auxin-responsive promoter family protein [Phycisphaerae bacterium]
MNRFFEATSHLKEIQRAVLRRQMQIVAGSRFAEDFGLGHVDNYDDFRRKLPVFRYDNLKPYIERLKNGDTGALFNSSEKLLMFALTSGTTAEPKFIPVTKRFVDDYRRGWNIFGLKALLDHPGAFFRKIVQITSSAREIQTPGGIWAGAITGLLAQTQKWIVRKHYVTPLCVSQIKDPVAKMYAVARLAIREDVAFMNTANPSTTLRLARVIEEYGPQLIRDIHDGKLRPPTDISEDVIHSLHLSADRKSASRLAKILDEKGKLLPKDVWQLSFINNWTGGTLKLYLQKFPDYFGSTPIRDLGLLASEGRFSIPISDQTSAGILEITSNFFEFIPESEYDQKSPTVLTADQLQKDEKYFLLFSNATGLCRYDIGDLVRVVDFYNETPMIEFLNKGAHISSITGEKITERQVVEAVEIMGQKIGIKIDSFLVGPKWGDPPYYVLTLEKSTADHRSQELGRQFDQILRQLNIEYESKRSSGRLGPVLVQPVADGFFQSDDLKRLSAGGRGEQYKRKFLLTQIEPESKV